MMKAKNNIFAMVLTAIAVLVAPSCRKVQECGAQVNFRVELRDCLGVVEESRAGEEKTVKVSDLTSVPAPEAFHILITNQKSQTIFSGSLKEWKDSQISLMSGDYTVTASFGKEGTEGKDCPYFRGSSNFEIDSDDTVNVPVTVTLANCVVRTSVTDAFTKYFRDYCIDVTSVAGNKFSFSRENSPVVFIDAFKMTVSGKLTNQAGSVTELTPAEINLQPATCYTLVFDASQTGVVKVAVCFDDKIIDIDLGQIELND